MQQNSTEQGDPSSPGCSCACQGWWTRHGDMAPVWNVRLSRRERFLGMWMNLLGADDKLLGVSCFLPYGSSSEDEASPQRLSPKHRLLLAFLSLMLTKCSSQLSCSPVWACPEMPELPAALGEQTFPEMQPFPRTGLCWPLLSPLLHSALLWAQGGDNDPGALSQNELGCGARLLSKHNLIQLRVVFLG